VAATPLPVSVAVSTAGRPAALKRCLESLIAGERLPEQVVVVDQSRDDDSREVVDALGAHGVSVTYLKQAVTGLSISRNLALAQATQPFVAFIDDDCVATPGWLLAVHSAFEASRASCVTGPVLPQGASEENGFAVSSRTSTEAQTFTGSVAPWLAGTGGNLALRRARLRERRVFDARLGAGSSGRAGEDVDLLRRLLRDGHAVHYSPEAIVLHERRSLERRLRSRFGYGHGVGAAGALWLRSGDRYGLRMLLLWLRMRLGLLRAGLWERPGSALWEEALVLAGTLRGVVYGALVACRTPP
jgi:GT2 family glycosyltransferase